MSSHYRQFKMKSEILTILLPRDVRVDDLDSISLVRELQDKELEDNLRRICVSRKKVGLILVSRFRWIARAYIIRVCYESNRNRCNDSDTDSGGEELLNYWPVSG